MKILFWLNKSKINRTCEAPMMMRLTHNGVRHNITLDLKLRESVWDSKRQKVRGNNESSDNANNLIRSYHNRAIDALDKILKEKEDITLEDIVQKFKGEEIKEVGFLEFFNTYIANMEARIGVDFHPATVVKYKSTKQNLSYFMRDRYNCKDIPIRHVTRVVVGDINQYFRGDKHFHNNHVNKMLSQMKRVYRSALQFGLVQENPFDFLSFKRTETHKDYLTMDELRRLISSEPSSKRMVETRDIFIFLCFTGLAHVDAQKVTHDDIMIGVDGNPWLMLRRTKTTTLVTVPILPIVSKLIDKYSGHPKCLKEKKLMPVPTNQVLNRSLKLLATEIGFNKKLSSHCGRYTFASTVLLSNGVRVEVAQRLLAHTNIKSTMIYGKLSQLSIANDVGQLNRVLSTALEPRNNADDKELLSI